MLLAHKKLIREKLAEEAEQNVKQGRPRAIAALRLHQLSATAY